MTREERNTKLKNFITCLKCEVSGKECDDNCPVQYEAGNMGEIIENLEAISKALEQEPCEDVISRQAALNSLIDNTHLDGYDLAEALDAIENKEKLPSVTSTQKYGKWIVHPEIETSTPEYLMFYECSECGDKQCFCKSDIHKKRFCSNCGAKMQESEDKE